MLSMSSPNPPARSTASRALPTSSVPNSPTPASGGTRKRKALSCYDCRRRKMKCDREYPSCGRCRKGGLANSCSYDQRSLPSMEKAGEGLGLGMSSDIGVGVRAEPGAVSPLSPKESTVRISSTSAAPSQPHLYWPSSTPVAAHADARERQIHRLENRLSTLETSLTSGTWQRQGEVASATVNGEPIVASPSDSAPPETVIFRGENFSTQYFGGSNPTSLIAHFPELRSFVREAIMHHASQSSLPRVQRDVKALLGRWKGEKPNVLPVIDSELYLLLPDRDTVDYFVRLYFDTFEPIYRILHRPSFWEEYKMFWESQQTSKPSFIILLLLIMAAVSCTFPKKQPPTYIGDSSIAREQAVMWISVSEWWLGNHSQKNVYLAIWQIRCLLVLAKQVNIVKKKRHWTVAGTLVREAMSAGFHRDPSVLGEKVSVFDQEMRRRLWATMVELELQTSIDRGMYSASAGIPSDSETVSNINDEDFTVECHTLPPSKPWREYTTSSFLHISRASFPLRVALASRVNDLSTPLRYEEVLTYEETITKELQRLPRKAGPGEIQDSQEMPAVARTLLDVQLRQFLILLHAPFARQADANSRYVLSRMICFNAAASIIEQYSHLNSSGNFLLLLLRHDYFMGALVICHNMYISISLKNDLFLRASSDTFIQYVEDAITMLDNKITILGTGYTYYWYISAGCALLRSATSPEQSTVQKQQAIDRLKRQYSRVLASQEDFSKAREKIVPISFNKVNPTGDHLQITSNMSNAPGLSFLDHSVPQVAFEPMDLPLEEFYYGDPAVWTFDDLWEIE